MCISFFGVCGGGVGGGGGEKGVPKRSKTHYSFNV